LGFLLLAVRTGYFPTGGMVALGFADLGPWDKIKDALSHFLLPVTALTLVSLPVLIRHVRASLLDVLHAPYIQAARAIGISERRLLFHHALRAAANPLISLLGLSVAALLSVSLVVETVMSWPGLGPLLLEAVVARDLHLVVGAVTCSTLLLIAGSLLSDGLLYLVDPRTRPGQG
jgi:peptide/nickel transport system permease protein